MEDGASWGGGCASCPGRPVANRKVLRIQGGSREGHFGPHSCETLEPSVVLFGMAQFPPTPSLSEFLRPGLALLWKAPPSSL